MQARSSAESLRPGPTLIQKGNCASSGVPESRMAAPEPACCRVVEISVSVAVAEVWWRRWRQDTVAGSVRSHTELPRAPPCRLLYTTTRLAHPPRPTPLDSPPAPSAIAPLPPTQGQTLSMGVRPRPDMTKLLVDACASICNMRYGTHGGADHTVPLYFVNIFPS